MQHLNRKYFIGPSILAADFAFLYKQCRQMLDLGANSLHVDIMDGHFVPNLSFGAPILSSLRKHLPEAYFDCHLMVTHPRHYIQSLAKAGANCFTFHYEIDEQDLDQLCDSIRQRKMHVGLSIKPKTAIDGRIEKLIQDKKIDKLLVMTVQPGFGGQKYMSNMMDKVSYLHQRYPELDIQVDGGIGPQNAQEVARYGANWLVAGTSLFNAADRRETIKNIEQAIRKGLGLND